MVITTSIENLDGLWIYCYTCCILGRTPQMKETLSDFCENMDPDKWDTTVWYRVTRNPQEFRELIGSQRDPRVLGRHIRCKNALDVRPYVHSGSQFFFSLTMPLMFLL